MGRRSVLALLLAIIVLAVLLRYPLVEHERQQTDSYFIHLLSSSIIENGCAEWTFSPLSYFGYYPFSYPSGVPFLLSELSMMTGLTMEPSILLANMIFGALFCLVMFMLARTFIAKPQYVVLAVLFAVTGSRFVDTTYWNASARGPAIVLIILLVTVLLQVRPASSPKPYALAVPLGLGCFVCHHIAVLLAAFAFVYLIVSFEIQYVLPKFRRQRKFSAVVFNSAMLIALMLISFLFFDIFRNLMLVNLQKTSLFGIDHPVLSTVVNAASAYTNQIGFVLPVAILGIPTILRRKAFTERILFLFLVLVAFVPLLGNQLYVSMLLAPFISVIGTIGLSSMRLNGAKKTAAVAGVCLLIASSIAMPVWSTSRWNSVEYFGGDTVEVGFDLYNDGTYLQHSVGEASAISNVNLVTWQVAATSGVDFLGPDILLTLNGDIGPEDAERNISWSDASFPVNLYRWFDYESDTHINSYVTILMVYGLSVIYEDTVLADTRTYYERHPHIVAFIDNGWDLEYVDAYSVRPSAFAEELYACEYRITPDQSVQIDAFVLYSSERSTIFLVDLFGSTDTSLHY